MSEETDYRITLKEFPEELQPRERMSRFGATSLADHELLALLLSTGSGKQNALELGQAVLHRFGGLKGMTDLELEELYEISGIAIGKGTRIIAALELGKRVGAQSTDYGAKINSPAAAGKLVMDEMRFLDREVFKIILLNTKHRVLGIETISVGDLNSSLVNPREVFKPAVKKSAKALICTHNHPSGDPTPSQEDIAITHRLIEAGKLLDISVLDHLIIGADKYYSLKEHGHI